MVKSATKLTLALLLVMLPARAGSIDPATLPESQRENYEIFRVRCSKCHTTDKPYNVHLSPEAWKRYVGKMMRRPGSGISAANGEKIVEFLIYKETRGEGSDAPIPVTATADAGP